LSRPGLTEKELFGGVAFLLHGNMCAGVRDEDLIVRVEPAETDALLREPGAKPFTLAGRGGMAGWLLVDPEGYETDVGLRAWVARGIAYASSLPAKKAGGSKGSTPPTRR
jgi:TfoX/Sxy family transcriptional regulator of competence genes